MSVLMVFQIGDLVRYELPQIDMPLFKLKMGIVYDIVPRPHLPQRYKIKWLTGATNRNGSLYESTHLTLVARGESQVAEVIEENCNKENGSG
jgi:hypothetical protein